jgi:hypothetical protein
MVLVLLLNGCGGGSSPSDSPVVNPTPIHKIVINDDIHVEKLGMENNISINVEIGSTPKDIFILSTIVKVNMLL